MDSNRLLSFFKVANIKSKRLLSFTITNFKNFQRETSLNHTLMNSKMIYLKRYSMLSANVRLNSCFSNTNRVFLQAQCKSTQLQKKKEQIWRRSRLTTYTIFFIETQQKWRVRAIWIKMFKLDRTDISIL